MKNTKAHNTPIVSLPISRLEGAALIKLPPDQVARKRSVPGRTVGATRVGGGDSKDLYDNLIELRLRDADAGEFY